MSRSNFSALESLLDEFSGIEAVAALQTKLKSTLPEDVSPPHLNDLLALYHESLAIINPELISPDISRDLLDCWHKVYQELESLISLTGNDQRHRFVVVIPVADRPKHLLACLQSLHTLCELFLYGGRKAGKYQKVQVIVADDSRDQSNIDMHKQIANEFTGKGLDTEYFSLEAQLNQVAELPAELRSGLSSVIGQNDASSFYHKGASIMRNIVYLKLNELSRNDNKYLFYFIDSDQEFNVKVSANDGDKNLYLINYFYELDKIFTQKDITMLTGKVVGDPPVSPAVMAGNFLDDVTAFLYQSSKIDSQATCEFHAQETQQVSDASYHDMAELFGFKQKSHSFNYNCILQDAHTNEACFIKFSEELNRFFYGEHPTRKMYYEYEDALSSVKSARTVYTGNYVFNSQGLKYFIPFAPLKLRMAGPVLGRIIKSELAHRFVSANLPMLHKRTFEETGVSEFRSGIMQSHDLIDLSGEFERQYFGDVMLFSIEQLTQTGCPDKICSEDEIRAVLHSVEQSVNQKYSAKQTEIMDKSNRLNELFFSREHWWNHKPELVEACKQIQCFIDNIRHNFSSQSKGLALINNESHKLKRLQQMAESINELNADRVAWLEAMQLNQALLAESSIT